MTNLDPRALDAAIVAWKSPRQHDSVEGNTEAAITAYLESLPPQPVEVTEEMERTITGETVLGMPVAAYMEETELGGKFATHWSTIPERNNPVRLFAESDVRKRLAAIRPSGDGIRAGRAEVIEECAKVIDAAEAEWFAQYQATMHPAKQGNILAKRNAALKLAAAIRALIVPQEAVKE